MIYYDEYIFLKVELMKFLLKKIPHLSLLFLFIGCSAQRENRTILASRIQNKNVIMTHALKKDEAEFYKEGQQGLIDILISDAITDSISQGIKNTKATPLIEEHYYSPFKSALESRSVRTTRLSVPLKIDHLKHHSKNDSKYALYDFTHLRNKGNYALVLTVSNFGVYRTYYGFIPTSSPYGYADLDISLVNLQDNSLEAYYKADIKVPVIGEWDSPPQYTQLKQSIKNALKKGIHNAYAHFFRW